MGFAHVIVLILLKRVNTSYDPPIPPNVHPDKGVKRRLSKWLMSLSGGEKYFLGVK